MKIKIYLIILFIFFLTGCWNYRELNDMSLVGALGIDYDETKNTFQLSAQIFKAKKISSNSSSSNEESPIILYQEEAKTLHEALRKMVFVSSKKLYIGHIDVIIISKEIAENHLIESLDFLFRDPESRKDFYILIASENKASEILEVLTPLNTIPSASIKETMESNMNYKGNISAVFFDKFLAMLYQEGLEAVIPVITIKNNNEEGTTTENTKASVAKMDLEISKEAVFKDNKYLGDLNEKESFGYNLLLGNIKESVFSFPCDEKNSASIEFLNSKSNIEVKLNKKNVPSAKIEIDIEASISEVNCAINIIDIEGIETIEKNAKKELKKIIFSIIDTSQKKFNSDILGFGEYLYRNENKYWKKNNSKWYEIFPNIKYEVNINLKLSKKGASINTVKEQADDKKE